MNANMFTAYHPVFEGLGYIPRKTNHTNELKCYSSTKVLGKVMVTLQSKIKRQLNCTGVQQAREKD